VTAEANTAPETTPATGLGETPTIPVRLPDDHPAAVALNKANEEAKTLRLRVKEYEDASKTETQKLADQIAELEQARDRAADEAKTARAEAVRFKVAATFGLSSEDAELFLTGDDEETLTRQAKRFNEHVQERSKPGLHIRREGGNGEGNTSSADLFAAVVRDQLS
jgi:hypothetical protein